MKTFKKEIKGYTYKELNDGARETVKQWLLYDAARVDMLYEDMLNDLNYLFPNSNLNVQFSLSSCQGDGLNIYGTIALKDFLPLWKAPNEKARRTMQYYIAHGCSDYELQKNDTRYCYSCKFLEIKDLDVITGAFAAYLTDNIASIKTDVIWQFFYDMLTYMQDLDAAYEHNGYDYLYNMRDEEASDICDANSYYFDACGGFIGSDFKVVA